MPEPKQKPKRRRRWLTYSLRSFLLVVTIGCIALKNLKSLWLDDTKVVDLSPLAGLKNLERIFLHNTQVVDLSPLAGVKNLKQLGLNNTQVTDVSPFGGIKES